MQPLPGAKLLHQGAGEHERCEEVHLEHMAPDGERGVDRAEAFPRLALGRDALHC